MKNMLPVMLLIVMLAFSANAQTSVLNTAPQFGIWNMSNFVFDNSVDKTPNTEFRFSSLRFIVTGNATPEVSYHVAADFNDESNKKSVFKQGWIMYNVNDLVQLRIGQFKYPFGKETYTSLIYQKFANPSYVLGNIAAKLGNDGGSYRDIGIEASRKLILTEGISAELKAMVMNGSGPNSPDKNNQKDFVSHLGFQFKDFAQLGFSHYTGKANFVTITSDEAAYGTDIAFNYNSLTLQAEYIKSVYKYDSIKPDEISSGFYFYGVWMPKEKIEVGVRLDSYDRSKAIAEDTISRLTLLAGYYFTNKSKITFNYEFRNDESSYKVKDMAVVVFQTAI
ncbi:MAG: OprO/OprP family phosphate-selective porin [Bacteroidetes bacterium]|nr:OprO/OprP family phosphate-selective porin [Bacteroidota bacterium]MBU1678710.1 OprO/OprP family phosphate-selective porin [Bacteroidota bacterium]